MTSSPRRRLALALAAALGLPLSLALGACGEEAPRPKPPREPAAGAPAPDAPAGAPVAGRPVFETAAQCGKCHEEIYEEWKASWHGQAMSDPLFLELSENLRQEECIRCHAPVPLREADFETPLARSYRREDAISCLSCHQSGGNVAGPSKGLTGACLPVHDPAQTDPVKMCFGCHDQHKTGEEWLAGPYSPEAGDPREVPVRTCLDCHMEEVVRPVVTGGVPRKGRRHTWPGGHDMTQLRKAATLEVETSPLEGGGVRVRTWVTNVGAGHNIPTDARHRSFDVYVKVWDAEGNVVLDPLDPAQAERAMTAKYRLNYRNSGLPDTQIPPRQRVSGLGRHPGYVDLPGVSKGRGEAWLVYRLTPADALVPESLDDPEFSLYRARRVTKTPFAFGEGE
jgi:hypothetical protein